MLVSGSGKAPKRIEDLLGPELMARLDRLDLLSRKIFAGKLPGERRSKKRGRSVEFADYREYAPGDDLRHIDWNVYARFDRLFIKLFLEEEDMTLHVVLDASASMDAGNPNKLLFAQRLAMAFGYIGLVNRNRVAVTAFGGRGLQRLPEMRGRRNVQRLGRFILDQFPTAEPAAPAPQAGPVDFNTAMKQLALTRRGKGVMVILSDFLFHEGYDDGLRLLAGKGGFDTYCMHILAPGEIEPERERDETLAGGLTGDVRLTDVETGRAAEVTVSAALLKKYKETLERYCDDLAARCAALEMTYLLVRSDAELESLILDTFRKRGLLR